MLGLIVRDTGAAILFALALLCAGESAGITATLAGQVVSEGFLRWHISVRQPHMVKSQISKTNFSLACSPPLTYETNWPNSGFVSRSYHGSTRPEYTSGGFSSHPIIRASLCRIPFSLDHVFVQADARKGRSERTSGRA